MNKKLTEIINNLKGSLLGIGLNDDTLLDAIEKNDSIYTCYLLTNISKTGKKFSMTKLHNYNYYTALKNIIKMN